MGDTTMEVEDIDDSLYSRQRYVLGDGAMQKLARSNVLIIGLGGVGVEVAKNIILAGVKHVTFHDNRISQSSDLGTQFYIRQQDVQNKLLRSRACLERLGELNPYVSVECTEEDVVNQHQLLTKYQCVVVSELGFKEQTTLNNFCRSQNPPISFISCDVVGLFSYVFCDFGDNFQVHDTDGEEPKEIFIHSISKSNPCTIKTLENRRHNLDTGDHVTFREINGMTQMNNKQHKITYVDPFTFTIDLDTTPETYSPHLHGGICMKIKQPTSLTFEPLHQQLKSPHLTISDLSKLDNPLQTLLCFITYYEYMAKHAGTSLTDNVDAFIDIAVGVVASMRDSPNVNNTDLLKTFARTCGGVLAPLCAAVGGVASQEVLKAISGKFTPLKQWLCLDAVELAPKQMLAGKEGDRYNPMRHCLSNELVTSVHSLNLFMVGCGAIGCEMLKNFALLGVGGNGGALTITDNDLIEKSNLNRQFLFRPWHIQKSKSVTGAESVTEINPDLNIVAQQNKVCPETQAEFYNDDFFQQQHIVVNALDNVEARRYVDGRCVANQKALIETGTMGAKGHVQVIVPHLTESYSSQRDPVEEDVPYCTLKSFPQVIEHTIQWARDKFESLFTLKPTQYNQFWNTYTAPHHLKQSVVNDSCSVPDGFIDSVNLFKNKPSSWQSCVAWARCKFQIYFNHKAQELLRAFPLDSTLADGSLFWQSPKRPPTPISFDENDETHFAFVVSFAKIQARIHNVEVTPTDLEEEVVKNILRNVDIPQWRPSNKKIETDETKSKSEATSSQEENVDKVTRLINFLHTQDAQTVQELVPEHFEKDQDSNSHIDFITASSNLRASMYNIELADRFKTKRIAGRIIPAIATTTAAIAGLATIELLKVINKHPVEELKNCFLNLALPMIVLSEPGPLPKTKIRDGLEFSVWDRWDVQGHKDFKLNDFIQHFKNKLDLEVNMVCEGVKMIYVPIMPGHKKRVNDLMSKLLKPKKGAVYTDLVVSFTNEMCEDEDLPSPPVRYYYNINT